MSDRVIEMHASRITIDAIGPPGKRRFLLQASEGYQTVTLKMEKQQAEVLAMGIGKILDELAEKFPGGIPGMEDPFSSELLLLEPIEIMFTIGQMGLGYDESKDALVLVMQELALPEDAATAKVARFWATRAQMLALSRRVEEVTAQGRDVCPLCAKPIDPTGHFCPKSNGRERAALG